MKLILKQQFETLTDIAMAYRDLALEASRKFERKTRWSSKPFSILIAMSFSEDLTAEFYETTVEEMSKLQETDSSALLYFVIGNDKYNDAGVPRTRIVMHNMPDHNEKIVFLKTLADDEYYWRRTLVGDLQYNLDNQRDVDNAHFGFARSALNQPTETSEYRLMSKHPIQNLNRSRY